MFKIKVVNFQSIESAEVEISGFTTITGRSNIGKTALLRAVSSSVFNKPVGSYLRDPKKPVIVEVRAPDIQYEWKKGDKQINQYKIGDQLYDKCGSDGITSLRPEWFKSIKLGDKEVYPWYASQFSPLFLIDETSGKISEFFAEFCRIGLINKAIKLAQTHKREKDMIAKHLEAQIARLSDKITKFEPLKKYKDIAIDLQAQKASIEEFESTIELRTKFENQINTSRRSLGTLGVISRTKIPEMELIDPLVSQCRHVSILENSHNQAIYKLYSIAAVEDAKIPDLPEVPRLALLEKASKLQKISKNQIVPQIPLPPSAEDYRMLKDFQQKLDKLYDSFVSLKGHLKTISVGDIKKEYYQYKILLEKEKTALIQNKIRALVGSIKTVEDQISEIPKCPSCDRPVDSTHIHQVSSEESV